MYKIYINDNPFYLLKYNEVENIQEEGIEIFPYMGNMSVLINVIDQLEKSTRPRKFGFYAHNYEGLKKDFTSLFKKIGAMGGIVTNSNEEVLFIYRRGRWDLPKGKKEKNETKKECAVREVAEETGLENLNLNSKVGKTRHTYRDPRTGERVLKTTYWYAMSSPGQETLQLQSEEDIEDARWMEVDDFLNGNYITFGNIIDILHKFRATRVNSK